jgi:Zn-dependent protease with chaperone function
VLVASWWRGRRWIPLSMLAGGVLAHVGMGTGLVPCPSMSMAGCLASAIGLVAAISLAATAVRAGWLARRAGRAVAALPHAAVPVRLRAAAGRAGVTRLVGLAGGRPAAFCAGLWRPRVYVTAATAELDPAALQAVLVHEAVHAHRRDPLRRLLTGAAADVLCWLPLARWWHDQAVRGAELSADRVAIAHLGARPVATALLSVGGTTDTTATGAVAFHDDAAADAVDARIGQLAGDPAPAPRPRVSAVLVSLSGLVAVTSLAMCLGQTLLTW